jgi:hypothetical protein
MLFVPLNRQLADAGYVAQFWLNIDQALSITRSADNTHTRIRGLFVYYPEQGSTEPVAIEALVLETPEQIAQLINNAATRGQRMIVRA